MKSCRIVVLSVVISLACPILASAYVDPGAGSMVLQLLLGGLAGMWVFGRLLRKRILRFLGLGKDRDKA